MGDTKLFSALLKHFRRGRGMSQLDLASAAEISARHLSFLETGRAKPSREMVLRLGETLGLTLRDMNALVVAAGFSKIFEETDVQALSPSIRFALERMMAASEPFPLIVFDGQYDIRMVNHAASRMLQLVLPGHSDKQLNLLTTCFDPEGLRPFIENWESVARHLLQRLSRDQLQTGRESLSFLLSRLLAYPGVPGDFRALDLAPTEPVLELGLSIRGQRLRFLTTVTSFNAPHDVTLEELRIESYFPLDEQTTQLCQLLAAQP